jgi:hypothetical protein
MSPVMPMLNGVMPALNRLTPVIETISPLRLGLRTRSWRQPPGLSDADSRGTDVLSGSDSEDKQFT